MFYNYNLFIFSSYFSPHSDHGRCECSCRKVACLKCWRTKAVIGSPVVFSHHIGGWKCHAVSWRNRESCFLLVSWRGLASCLLIVIISWKKVIRVCGGERWKYGLKKANSQCSVFFKVLIIIIRFLCLNLWVIMVIVDILVLFSTYILVPAKNTKWLDWGVLIGSILVLHTVPIPVSRCHVTRVLCYIIPVTSNTWRNIISIKIVLHLRFTINTGAATIVKQLVLCVL